MIAPTPRVTLLCRRCARLMSATVIVQECVLCIAAARAAWPNARPISWEMGGE